MIILFEEMISSVNALHQLHTDQKSSTALAFCRFSIFAPLIFCVLFKLSSTKYREMKFSVEDDVVPGKDDSGNDTFSNFIVHHDYVDAAVPIPYNNHELNIHASVVGILLVRFQTNILYHGW